MQETLSYFPAKRFQYVTRNLIFAPSICNNNNNNKNNNDNARPKVQSPKDLCIVIPCVLLTFDFEQQNRERRGRTSQHHARRELALLAIRGVMLALW